MEFETTDKARLCTLSFFAGGALGGAWEMVWNLVTGRGLAWTSGIMFFPLCNPIYGLGAALVTLYALHDKRPLARFLFAFLSIAAVEALASIGEEVLFGMRSWDYSAIPFNIDGRVNLLYLIFFTLAAMGFVHFILPQLVQLLVRKREGCTLALELLIPLYSLALTASLIFLLPDGACPDVAVRAFFYPAAVTV